MQRTVFSLALYLENARYGSVRYSITVRSFSVPMVHQTILPWLLIGWYVPLHSDVAVLNFIAWDDFYGNASCDVWQEARISFLTVTEPYEPARTYFRFV